MRKPRCRELPTQASYALRSGRAQIRAQAFGTTLRAGLPFVSKPPSLGQAKAHTARNRCGSLWVNVRKAYHVQLYRVFQEVFLGRSTRKCQTAVSPREKNRGRMRGVAFSSFYAEVLKNKLWASPQSPRNTCAQPTKDKTRPTHVYNSQPQQVKALSSSGWLHRQKDVLG